MEVLHFEVSVGWIKWPIISKYSYYELYEESARNALTFFKNITIGLIVMLRNI